MEAVRRRMMAVVGSKEKATNVFLLAALLALGIRSSKQQREIEALEAEKSSLRTENKAISSSLWEWRQHLFSLADSDAAPSLSKATLRKIYGDDDNDPSNPLPIPTDLAEEQDSISVA